MPRALLPTILLLATLGLIFSYISPSYSKVQDIKEEITRFDEALGKAKELQALRDQLLAKYNSFSARDLERLEKFLPDQIDNVRLIIDIDAIASRYGMTVKNLSIQGDSKERLQKTSVGNSTADISTSVPTPGARVLGSRPSSVIGSVIMTFSVSASYERFLQFLKDLERSLRLIDVVSLSFDASGEGVYNYNVGIKTYWLKNPR
jgi:hypothetical protein